MDFFNKDLISVNYAGMADGHAIRNGLKETKEDYIEKKADLLIVGSGISALTAIWKLLKEGYNKKIILITGSELFGNSADIEIKNNFYPTGAHYLPLQNKESFHTREMLKFFDIIKEGENEEKPFYNEENLVFSPMERVLFDNVWHEGVSKSNKNFIRFFNLMSEFRELKGGNGKSIFSIPSFLSSAENLNLDEISFKEWLSKNNFLDQDLLLHLDYCMKDDYGMTLDVVSAWAGIQYFAGRKGKCANTEEETILTWKNGNAHLAKKIFDYIRNKIEVIDASVYKIKNGKESLAVNFKDKKYYKINSDKIVLSTPLHVVNYLFEKPILNKSLLPKQAIWIVSNFLFEYLPYDKFSGENLAYDNVIFESDNLGYIHSENQSLYFDRKNKVLTTYLCVTGRDINKLRKEISNLKKEDLFSMAVKDLRLAYGDKALSLIKDVQITVRGHAMSYPEVGFKKRNEKLHVELNKLEKNGLYFAHSDLSSISIFEEASWWGYNVAKKILIA